MILKALREGLGRLIVFIDFLTRPKKMLRTAEEQEAVNRQVSGLSLYQYYACPFCVRVRREIHRLNLPIELRDAQNNQQFRQELLAEGGEIQVPCLRIDEDGKSLWMYESKEIIQYLQETFDPEMQQAGAA
jgi:glutaredoxin